VISVNGLVGLQICFEASLFEPCDLSIKLKRQSITTIALPNERFFTMLWGFAIIA